ncbi:hypothetical protein [Tenacibaculum ovolyticum]|uniref:hypothetical protein n=1 Tax=Tenacibaculum ovolyticum TaxID=104270 RepID=UPI00040F3A0D|nr:hypothetical protein [Tenacibaculum ovolyticum]
MGNFGRSLARELGKNTGKWMSNAVFGDKHATPHKFIYNRQVEQRNSERIQVKEYKIHQKELEISRRENEKELKRLAKEEAESQKRLIIGNNKIEVEEHNTYIQVIQSVHKDYSDYVDWNEIVNQDSPKYIQTVKEVSGIIEKKVDRYIEKSVEIYKNELDLSFCRKLFDKLFKNRFMFIKKLIFADDYKKEQSMQFQIEEKTNSRENLIHKKLEEHEEKRETYERELKKDEELLMVADGVIEKDLNAFTYAINLFNPFFDLKEYGSDLSFSVENNQISVDFFVHGEEVLPTVSKKTMRNGLEIKEELIPTSRFNEIYQDYVCSCILRIAKESFLLLPINRIIVNAKGSILNLATGNYEEEIIVAVQVERAILEKLNFDLLDPSESMSNFKHNMSFKKTSGFIPVSELS